MIIVSQDKETIVNFNVSFSAYIREKYDYDKNETIGYNIFVKHFEDVEFLGTYKTKERAKEVLQEIIKTHKISESYKYTRDVGLQSALTADIEMRNLILFRYEMPEE